MGLEMRQVQILNKFAILEQCGNLFRFFFGHLSHQILKPNTTEL